MTFKTGTEPDFEAQRAALEEQGRRARELMAKDPQLAYISAFIIAGDQMEAERSWDRLVKGEWPYARAELHAGSYARLDFAHRAMEAGYLPRDEFIRRLPELWSYNDPDDGDPRWLPLWREAFHANGDHYVRMGRPLPRTDPLRCFRGQDVGAPLGCAWSLDPKIAEKFAHGAATRQRNRAGHVVMTEVPRSRILAYLTERGESEVIFDPAGLRPVRHG